MDVNCIYSMRLNSFNDASSSAYSLPDPPTWKNSPPNMASVERAPPNGVLPHEEINGLPQIPEMSSLPSTMSELTASQFQERMHELKIEYTNLRPKNPEPVTTEHP